MMDVPALAAFLREHCAIDGRGMDRPRYVRCRVGKVSRRKGKLWQYAPYQLAGQDPSKAASDIWERLQGERGKDATNVWVEVMEKDGSNPVAASEPLHLPPSDNIEEEDDDDEGSAWMARPDRMVGHAVSALTTMADVQARAHQTSMNIAQGRITHLEGIVSTQAQELRKLAVDLAEAKCEAKIAKEAGEGMEIAMMREVAPHLPMLIQQGLAAWQTYAAAGDTGPAPEPGTDPGADLDACIRAMSDILRTHPDALTRERFDKLQPVATQAYLRAVAAGWVKAPGTTTK